MYYVSINLYRESDIYSYNILFPYPLSWLYNLFEDQIDKALRSALQKQVPTTHHVNTVKRKENQALFISLTMLAVSDLFFGA